MHKITVVIESATAEVSLGMHMAGGRVVAASEGDKLEELESYERMTQRNQDLLKGARLVGSIPPTPGRSA